MGVFVVKIETCRKEAFAVIGKEGSTAEGPGFIQRLWAEADAHFSEIAHLAKRDENGALIGLGAAGVLPPATSAMLHNLSTLGVSLHSMSALPRPKTE